MCAEIQNSPRVKGSGMDRNLYLKIITSVAVISCLKQNKNIYKMGHLRRRAMKLAANIMYDCSYRYREKRDSA
jgi:hypothetical protein